MQQIKSAMQLHQIIEAIRPLRTEDGLPKEYEINYLLTDSRQLGAYPEQTLFFALHTDKNDGANYIPDLYIKGVRAFVVTEEQYKVQGTTHYAQWIIVADVLRALQDLAAYKRSLYNCPVIAITGSNGKTIVKEWLYQLLRND